MKVKYENIFVDLPIRNWQKHSVVLKLINCREEIIDTYYNIVATYLIYWYCQQLTFLILAMKIKSFNEFLTEKNFRKLKKNFHIKNRVKIVWKCYHFWKMIILKFWWKCDVSRIIRFWFITKYQKLIDENLLIYRW